MNRLLEHAVFDGYDFGLQFRNVKGNSAVVGNAVFAGRYIGDRQHPYWRHWRLRGPVVGERYPELVAALIEVAKAAKAPVSETSESFWDRCTLAIEKPVPSAFAMSYAAEIYPVGDDVVFSGVYHGAAITVAKSMRGVWLKDMKGWRIPAASPHMLRENLIAEMELTDQQAERIRILAGQFGLVDGRLSPIEGLIHVPSAPFECTASGDAIPTESGAVLASTEITSESPADLRALAEDLSTYELDEYQRIGVRHLVGSTSALLADEPGLGKTRQSIVAAHLVSQFSNKPILIVAPASLLAGWRREIEVMFPDDSVSVRDLRPQVKWVVTNYEQLGALSKYPDRFACVVADEAHYLKTSTSLRTREAFNAVANIPYRYLLTGTPLLNREEELFTLLKLSGHLLGQLPLREFLDRYSGTETARRQLHQSISSWMLRRKKSVVLKELKGRREQLVHLELSELQRSQYNAIYNDMNLLSLEKITRLRQFLEAVKVDAIVDYALNLGGGDKIIVFADYISTVDAVAERLESLGVVTMTGSHSIPQRGRAEASFRDDPNIRAFVGTTAAAGVGLNLQAASTVAFCGLPWTPSQKDQAESRADRKGQTRLVISKVPIVAGTIDENLWQMLQTKKTLVDQVVDPEEEVDQARRELAARLARAA